MLKHKFITLFFIIHSSGILFANNGKHSLYIITNKNISVENSLHVNFINPDYEAFSQAYNNYSFGGGYTYGLNDFLGVGAHITSEKVKFDNYTIGENATASRLVYGLHFETVYPKSKMHMQAGGFLNTGTLKSDDFQFKLNGFEYGLYVGPELTMNNINLAVLFLPKFSYFYSKGEEKESVLILNPCISVKLSYTIKYRKTKEIDYRE